MPFVPMPLFPKHKLALLVMCKITVTVAITESGFGTGGHPDDSNTCGNEANYSPDNGDNNIKAMGYIFVQ